MSKNKFKKAVGDVLGAIAAPAAPAKPPKAEPTKATALAEIAGRQIPAVALVRLADRTWVRVRMIVEGDRVTAIETTEPDVKSVAAEKFKVDVAALLTGDGEPLR